MKKRKYNIDDNFFKVIDTEEKAYILGLMYVDGCVYTENTKWAKLDLKSDDAYILQEISEIMNNNCPIKTYVYDKKQYFSHQDKTYEFLHSMSRLSMRSDKIVDDLTRLGCGSKKTFDIKFPNEDIVPMNFIRHFIRGYFDGDGSVSFSKRESSSKHRSSYLHFSITFTGTYNFILPLKEFFKNNITVFEGDVRNRWNNTTNNCTLYIDGNNIIEKILDFLYEESNIYLQRKYEKYLLLKDEIKTRNEIKKYVDTHRNPMRKEAFNIYNNGKYIGTSDNRRKIEKESDELFGEHISRISITKCLHNVDEDYHGFKFVFVSEDNEIENPNYICCGKENIKIRRKIAQYDLEMNFIRYWDSLKEAYNFLGLNENNSSITNCCKGRQKTAYGYIWKYAS